MAVSVKNALGMKATLNRTPPLTEPTDWPRLAAAVCQYRRGTLPFAGAERDPVSGDGGNDPSAPATSATAIAWARPLAVNGATAKLAARMASAGVSNQRVASGWTSGENTSAWTVSITRLHSVNMSPISAVFIPRSCVPRNERPTSNAATAVAVTNEMTRSRSNVARPSGEPLDTCGLPARPFALGTNAQTASATANARPEVKRNGG